jgi:hypothetical protein
VIRIPYTLHWPEDAGGVESVDVRELSVSNSTSQPGESAVVEKGVFRGFVHWAKGTSDIVYVMNQHDENIIVETSPFTTRVIPTGGGINASASGGGANLSFEVPFPFSFPGRLRAGSADNSQIHTA